MKSSHKRGALGGLIWPGKSGKAPRERRVMQDKVKRGGESIPGRDRVLQSPPEAPCGAAQRGGGEDGCLCVVSRYSVHLSRLPHK